MELKLTTKQLDFLIKIIEDNLQKEHIDMNEIHNLYSKLIILTNERQKIQIEL